MQYLEDDMDDLFQRAADQYPLLTDAKDWDGLAAGLAEPDSRAKSNTNFKLKYIPAAILLLLLIGCLGYMINYNPKSNISKRDIKNDNPVLSTAEQLGITHISAKKEIDKKRSVNSESHNSLFQNKHVASGGTLLYETKIQTNSLNKIKPFKDSKLSHKDTLVDLEDIIRPVVAVINNLEASGTDITKSIKILPNLKIDTSKLTPPQQSKSKSSSKKKSFYVDLLAGIQLNQVAGQGFTKPGFILGINGGCRMNRNLGVELGILYSNKHYFSDGHYFDMGKAGASMPANMKILNLQGSSHLIEIPIGLRYNFTKAKYKWFITSGVSSFILTREQNNYVALINGVQQNINGMYQHKTAYLASTINFSMGTEFTVGKNQTRFKIEPFLQVPVKGMGVGLMSVTGAGIRIGIGLPFH